MPTLPPHVRRLVAEFLGTGLLLAIVIGSGIAAQRLSPADVGLQLLENAWATALGLAVLIVIFAPVSGAHFNPVVTAAAYVLTPRGERAVEAPLAACYVVAQVAGACGGAVLANVMFEVPTTISTHDRASTATFVSEVVATAGLIVLIFALVRTGRALWAGPAVGAYIGAAYWFTSSTSFANPAVTVGRIFSDTFAGIAPGSVVPFIAAQALGLGVGLVITLALFPRTPAK